MDQKYSFIYPYLIFKLGILIFFSSLLYEIIKTYPYDRTGFVIGLLFFCLAGGFMTYLHIRFLMPYEIILKNDALEYKTLFVSSTLGIASIVSIKDDLGRTGASYVIKSDDHKYILLPHNKAAESLIREIQRINTNVKTW